MHTVWGKKTEEFADRREAGGNNRP
jgi:hypothetical protein